MLRFVLETAKRYPDAPAYIDKLVSMKGTRSLTNCPSWCFLPVSAWNSIVAVLNNHIDGGLMPVSLGQDIAELAAVGTWRYSQGIYRFSPELLEALRESPVTGDIPSDVLLRLPEWCVYIETPGWKTRGDNGQEVECYGFYVHLDYDMEDGAPSLRLLIDKEDGFRLYVVYLGNWDIAEGYRKMIEFSLKIEREIGKIRTVVSDEQIKREAHDLMPFMSLLLYLCSQEPEIDDLRSPGEGPHRPQLKKTKKGFRLFPPDKVRTWSVGEKVGAELRKAYQPDPVATGRTVRAHVRRGHWHGFWKGHRNAERTFIYHWLSPLVVGKGKND